ncbi:MAG TPA: tripartite tricarboxylate transporter TctB family protein [Candidatus Avisuccinivibrio pullicola]|nr:tripartite tricarboxylate transporter TctB family protein [Candidatus Avisuccinivibrio pullicola]
MRIHDTVLGIIIMVIGIAVCIHSSTFPSQLDGKPGPALFPMVLSALFALCGLALAIRGLKDKEHRRLFTKVMDLRKGGLINMAATFLSVVFYVYAVEYLGFLITMGVILLVLLLLLKTRPVPAVIIAVLGSVGIYLIFAKGLLVPLPEGLIYF